MIAFDPYATTGTGAAAGLSAEQRRTIGDGLAGPLGGRRTVAWTERSNTESARRWRELSPDERRESLKQQAARGNSRAARVLRALDAGSLTDDELAEMGDYLARGVAVGRSGSSGLSMPFGDSMFGPWDTGSGVTGR